MALVSDFQTSPPSNWQKFESLCRDLWREIWNDPNTQKNGREGQKQNGVDIFGRPNKGILFAGIQCKWKKNDLNKNITEKEVKEEVQKAKNFVPRLSEFIIATTGSKDAKIEELARIITQEHEKENIFSVHIWSWDDIKERLDDFPDVRDKYYPQKSNKLDENKRENARKIIETIIRPLRDCAKVIKLSFETGDYIRELESRSTNLKLEFNGYEFIKVCEESNKFHLEDNNLLFIYKKDEILNENMPQIIARLGSYKKHIVALKMIIESLNTSNIPIFFEKYVAALIKDPDRKHDLAVDRDKEEYLFKLYATVITGKKRFNGHTWATDLRNSRSKEDKSKEILDIIKKDSDSNEIFVKVEYLKNEIIFDLNKLIYELTKLDGELQNKYIL